MVDRPSRALAFYCAHSTMDTRCTSCGAQWEQGKKMSDKVRQTQSEAFGLVVHVRAYMGAQPLRSLRTCILANAIDRPPNNCLSFKTINCTETYLKLYSHYPENAANSHTVFYFFQFKFPFGDIVVHLARRFLVPSPVSYALIEVIHPFCIDKARKRGCILEHPCCKSQF